MAEMTPAGFVERIDRWELPLAREIVTRCIYDYAFTLVVGERAPCFEIRIENTFVVRDGGGTTASIEPAGEPQELAGSLRLLRKSVTRAIAYKDGRLEIDFDGGYRLLAQPDGEFESWQFTGPGGLRMMANTDGELVVWS